MSPDRHPRKPRLVYLDRDQEGAHEFRDVLTQCGEVVDCLELNAALAALHNQPGAVGLFDTATLLDAPASEIAQLVDLRGRVPIGLVSAQPLEAYIERLRVWGLLQVFIKTPPINAHRAEHFVRMVCDPAAGFGLLTYLIYTMEMYSVSVRSTETKVAAIDRVINHFTSRGFDPGELYDVRLILEEITNNALFHAFHTASGEEKYSALEFRELGPEESVRIEYGSDHSLVGFSVTDNAGRLEIPTVLRKLERQLSVDGVLDESGRGIYLSRMLSTELIINIEEGKRTQLIALFDETRRSDRPKPLIVNYIGRDRFDEWGTEIDLD